MNDWKKLTNNDLDQLKKTPSSGVIGTTRVKQFNDEELDEFKRILNKYNISYFNRRFYNNRKSKTVLYN